MNQPTRPFYERLLRLNHLRLRGPVAFALFEGSIGVAVLLALAEFVSWWGVLAIPASVALMVKLNDIVAGAAIRPLVFAATPRLAGVVVGRSPVPRPSLTVAIGGDDAVPDPAADPDSPPTARGRAASIARGVAIVPSVDPQEPRPMPRARMPQIPLRNAAAPPAEFGDPTPKPDPSIRRNQGRFTP
jgi:hypothetical protein